MTFRYSAYWDSRTTVVAINRFPFDTDVDAQVEGLRIKNATENGQFTVVDRFVTNDGYHATDVGYISSIEGHRFYVMLRMILVDSRTMYRILVAVDMDRIGPKLALRIWRQFAESFRLLRPAASPELPAGFVLDKA
jgi:hypothetical protein